jgi:hypothetical protein
VSFSTQKVLSAHAEDAALFRMRIDSDSFERPGLSTATSTTSLFTQALNRMTSFMLPLGIAASFFAPDVEGVRRRVRLGSGTDYRIAFIPDLSDEAAWRLVLEPVSIEEVTELRRIWELPYAGPVEFDFRASPD